MIFLIGYFVAKDPTYWRTIDRVWPIAPALALATWLILANGQAVGDRLGQFLPDVTVRFVFSYVAILYAWSCILTLLGVGQRFLNRESRMLRYLTSAIFCYYVLHQTIIVVAGYYLTSMRLGALPEFLLLTTITVAGCLLGYETLRRIPGLGIFMGVRRSSGFSSSKS
jgi:surface polysaccharide O-acyltransferase-like enzyme